MKALLKPFGFLFETLCVRDLRVLADSLGSDNLIEEGTENSSFPFCNPKSF